MLNKELILSNSQENIIFKSEFDNSSHNFCNLWINTSLCSISSTTIFQFTTQLL